MKINTINNFNEKYKDYLPKGWYGLDIEIPKVIEYLDKLFEDELIKIPGFEYHQIKLKFGQCRFYSNLMDLFDDFGYEKEREIEEDINNIIKELGNKE